MSTASGERRLRLAKSRDALYTIPLKKLHELPGRPHVVYSLKSYADTPNAAEAAETARNDLPFLFKAFESGQIGPKRMAKMHGGKPRTSTIHEYLDWTVTAQAAQEDDELDFGGFRILELLPRYVSHWPIKDHPGNTEGKRTHEQLCAPLPPLPFLQTHGRALSAATIRSGPGYLEIPFVATHEGKRGRGYCRCLLEAMEAIARVLGLPKLMLCSTNDPIVKSTWFHLGFEFTTEQQMEQWDTPHSDLVYLQNTTQMHKDVPGMGIYRPVKIKQGLFQQRVYARLDHQPKRPKLHVAPPKKAPPKKAINLTQQPSLGRPLLLLPAPSQSLASLATNNVSGTESHSQLLDMTSAPAKGPGQHQHQQQEQEQQEQQLDGTGPATQHHNGVINAPEGTVMNHENAANMPNTATANDYQLPINQQQTDAPDLSMLVGAGPGQLTIPQAIQMLEAVRDSTPNPTQSVGSRTTTPPPLHMSGLQGSTVAVTTTIPAVNGDNNMQEEQQSQGLNTVQTPTVQGNGDVVQSGVNQNSASPSPPPTTQHQHSPYVQQLQQQQRDFMLKHQQHSDKDHSSSATWHDRQAATLRMPAPDNGHDGSPNNLAPPDSIATNTQQLPLSLACQMQSQSAVGNIMSAGIEMDVQSNSLGTSKLQI